MKQIVWGLFLMFVLTGVVLGQETFDVQDFSDDYYGKVYLEQPNEVFSKGWVAIYRKKTEKLLFKVQSEELAVDFDNGKVRTNILQLPYGEQSVIIYDDFNFDGQKDFAVMDGQNSCYHGPSFKIFLATKSKSRFSLNKSFTELSQNNCGMFNVVPEKKQLTTMTKSTCCWHQYSTYIIQNNKPKAIEVIEETYASPYITNDIQKWNGTKMVKTQEIKLNLDTKNSEMLFSLKIKNNRQIHLFKMYGLLNYVILNEKNNVEMALPENINSPNTKFVLNSKNNTTELSFKHFGFEYEIYETKEDKIGIRVKRKGVLQQRILGDYDSKTGNLDNLTTETLDNLILSK